MTKSLCRPLRASIPSSILVSRSNLSVPQPHETDPNRDPFVPAPAEVSSSMLPDHCYEFGNNDLDSLTGHQNGFSWRNLDLRSNPRQLPRYNSSRSSPLNGGSQALYANPAVKREGMLQWSTEERHEIVPPAYLPTASDPCQYADLDHIGDGNNQWDTPDYSSYFTDYPTPQSDFPQSSPRQDRGEITSMPFCGTTEQGVLYAHADTAMLREHSRGLLTANGHFPQTPGISPSSEARSLYNLGQRDQHPVDEDGDSDGDDSISCEPYAQLIGRALKSAPGHRMVLKDIYRWFEKNTNKARGNSKGWQNSIRHNLSMNGVRS